MQEYPEQEIIEVTADVESLKLLWEKVRETSSLIASLKEENLALKIKVQDLESEISQAHNQFIDRNAEIERLRFEIKYLSEKEVLHEISFNADEKQKLQQKIKSLIAIIDTHLLT